MNAIVAGIISGLISPLILSWLKHRIIWKSQKRFEIKLKVFTDAVTALSYLESDALNFFLQKNKPIYKNMQKTTEFKSETIELKERARGMVKAFFSHKAYEKLDHAFRTKISIEGTPNIEFEKNRIEAIETLAKELGIDKETTWWKAITIAYRPT